MSSDDETLVGADEAQSPDGESGPGVTAFEDEPAHDSVDRARSEAAVMSELFGSTAAPEPKRFGRFLLVERLGAGAMGEVYLAEDTELGRLVALKRILSVSGRDDAFAKRREQRMIREARALAKIDHPNVVRVYDVQKERGEVYISMEYVKGQTLKGWLGSESRKLETILDAFVQAGRGLAAAHAVDLVHRDFKPDNALVGEDGRVRVVDFGLARADTDETAEALDESLSDGSLDFPGFESASRGDNTAESSNGSAATDPRLRLRLTRTGAMMGTPAYMAPEQMFRGTVDHRSDQFAYCVALHEAVYGARPFEGNNVYELAEAMMSDRMVTPSGRSVPRWLHEAIVRGLARDPGARFESMDALLAIIDPSIRRTRRRNWVLGGGVALTLGAAVVVARLTAPGEGPPPDPCPDPSEAIRDTWADGRSQQLAEHFGAVAPESYAAELHGAVAAQLDAYADTWVSARQRACVATKVEGAYSERVLDLRTRCLDRREHELDQLLARLIEGDEKLVRRAPEVVADLTPVEVCEDIDRLEAAYAPPDDPEEAEKVEAAKRLIDEARAAQRVAAYDEAKKLIDQAREQLGEVKHAPTEADLHLTRGDVLRNLDAEAETERAYLDAAAAAERGRHDRAAASAWIALVHHTADTKQDHEQAGFYLERAQAAVGRLGDPPRAVGKLDRVRGSQLAAAGKYAEAIKVLTAGRERLATLPERDASLELFIANVDQNIARARWLKGEYLEAAVEFERALPVFEAEYGEHHPSVARILNSLGSALITGGKAAESIPHLERALAIRKASLGDDSAKVAQTINALASAYYVQGRCDEALPLYRQAVEMQEAKSGKDHPNVASPLANRGRCEVRLGDGEAAIASLSRALGIVEKTQGKDHPQVADMLTGLATAEVFAGRLQEGLAHHRRALEIRRVAMGEDNAKTAETGVTVADTQRRMGDTKSARRTLEQWLPVLVDKLGEAHPYVAQARTTLGLLELERGDVDAALVAFEAAAGALSDRETQDRALLDYGYGRALWETDPERARTMLESVAKLEGPLTAPVADKARAWLAAHAATG